jgi:inorganic pyrophosphatase
MVTKHEHLKSLSAFNGKAGVVNVIIETPKGSPNKYKYHDDLHLYEINNVMPAGVAFPYDFGFIPNTVGDDGDPLDVLVLMDFPVFPGCLVQSRLVGVILAEQGKKGKMIRNDRFIAVYKKSKLYENIAVISDIGDSMMNEIEHFFASYNQVRGRVFNPLGRLGPDDAVKLIKAGERKYRKR